MSVSSDSRSGITPLNLGVIIFMVLLCLGIAYSTAHFGTILPLLSIGLVCAIIYILVITNNPKIGFWSYVVYCFFVIFLLRHFDSFKFGNLTDILLIIPWIAMLMKPEKYDWSSIKNDYVYLVGAWGIVNLLQLLNPEGASLMGWLHEVRFTLLNWLFIAPLAFILLNSRKDLNRFLVVIIVLSVISTIYGIKQLFIGVSSSEEAFLAGSPTHRIFGQLRVFSFFSDAGQFGASQAHLGLVALILGLGPFKP